MSDNPSVEAAKETRVEASTTREPYRRPVLVRLGSLREMTLSASQSGNSDGATSGRNRKTGRGGKFDGAGRPL